MRIRNVILINFVSQALNFGIPILLIPFLIGNLGVDIYGYFVYIQTVLQFPAIIVEFGYSLSAVRVISRRKNNLALRSQAFWAFWIIQWCLLFICASCLMFFLWLINVDDSSWLYYAIGYLVVVGQVMAPIWLFQGMELAHKVVIGQAAVKLILLPFFFFAIKNSIASYLVCALVYFAIASLGGGVYILWMLFKLRLIKWNLPSYRYLLRIFRQSALIFYSKCFIFIYSNVPGILLAKVGGYTDLVIFNLADKLRIVMQLVMNPLNSAVAPRVSYLFKTKNDEVLLLFKKLIVSMVFVNVSAWVLFYLLSPLYVSIFGAGAVDFERTLHVVRLMIAIPLVVMFSAIVGVNIMIPLGMHKEFLYSTAIAAAVSLCLSYPLQSGFGAKGATLQILLAELSVVFVCGIIFIQKYGVSACSKFIKKILTAKN
jgi:PST family polysaccharide transporter